MSSTSRFRRHSYKAAMRPIRITTAPSITNEDLTSDNDNQVPTTTPESDHIVSNSTVDQQETQRMHSIEEDTIDPSIINRASTGSQYSCFQIGYTNRDSSSSSSSDDIDYYNRSNNQNCLEEEGVSSSQEKKDSSPFLHHCKSDTFLQKQSVHDEITGKTSGNISRRNTCAGVSIDAPMIERTAFVEEMEENDGETNMIRSKDTSSHSVQDKHTIEDGQLSPPTDEQFYSVRRSSSLSRRQSMSENDLYSTIDMTPADETAIENNNSEKKLLSRKNAVRIKDVPIRQTRSQSVIMSPAQSYVLPSISTPPTLPKRNFRPMLPPVPINHPLNQERKSSSSSIPKYKIMEKVGEVTIRKYRLHNPRNAEKLRKHLNSRKYDQVERDKNKDTPLHAIVRFKRKDQHELLLVLMVYSDFGTEEIDIPDIDGNTALHIAMFNKDFFTVKILLSFGANINATNKFTKTPLDILTNKNAEDPSTGNYDIWELFLSLDGASGNEIKPETSCVRHTRNIEDIRQNIQHRKSQEKVIPATVKIVEELEHYMNEMFRSYETIVNPDLQISLGLQQFEVRGWKDTALSPLHFQVRGGKRILFLDGGGIRGLIQIEILSMLEKKTGTKITQLFDWIVGTSTGGIVALGLVYGNKTLAEIRQFYFKMKDDVFATTRFGFGSNTNTTQALEEILKEQLTTNAKMSDVQEPKVLVAAVNKTTTRPTLTFFNNCLGNEFSNEYIWKVARYTSAAPMYFSELDGYIDGGILANNPSDYGLTVIQNFYQRKDSRLDIACVVSIGSGIFPAKPLGSTDVHEMLLGMNILNIQGIQKRAKNLMTLLSNALVGAEDIVKNCRSRCEAQKIPFHRFSPTFQDYTVDSDETDDKLLINMLIDTRIQAMREWSEQFDELKEIFDQAAEENRTATLIKLRKRKQRHNVAVAASQ